MTGGRRDPIRKPVAIGSRVFVGPASFIEMDVTIGDECVINARSVIKQGVKIPPRSIVHGNPARIICTIEFDGEGDPNLLFNRDALKLFK